MQKSGLLLLAGAGVANAAISLRAIMAAYPDYTGTAPTGWVAVSQNAPGDSLELTLAVGDLETSASGGVHIHVGTSCADASQVGGHYWTPDDVVDPWTAVQYSSSATGESGESLSVAGAGIDLADALHRTIVIHNSAGDKVGCGVLGVNAGLGAYPGYFGSVSVTGFVSVTDYTEGIIDGVTMNVQMDGLQASVTGGIHIHEGMTCAAADLVGGHWRSMEADPWTTVTYTSDSNGAVTTVLNVESGYGLSNNVFHAVVVHDQNGDKIACGTIGHMDLPQFGARMDVYPGYTGSQRVMGHVSVSQKDASTITLHTAIQGLESAGAVGGVHIHTGRSCAHEDLVDEGDEAHYWLPASEADPWTAVKYTSEGAGLSTENFDVVAGYDLADALGHTVVVHDQAGARVACGVLGYSLATMGPYPGADSKHVMGQVDVSEGSPGELMLSLTLHHLEPNAEGGVHIHAGLSCSATGLVGGHYWAGATEDPWIPIKWKSDAFGNAHHMVTVVAGLKFNQVSGHTVVVHDSSGAKVACGTIGEERQVVKTAVMDHYPGRDLTVNIMGTVKVSQTSSDTLTLHTQLTGLEPDGVGGVHIHAGDSCAHPDLVGGHFWTPSTDPDPWTAIKYKADSSGESMETIEVSMSGYNLDEVDHHTVVIHNVAGDKVACGVLGYNDAHMEAYPGYTGPITVMGFVTVNEAGMGKLALDLDLKHLEASSTGGVHIHAGLTCTSSKAVGGHWWKDQSIEDPWKVIKWTSDGQGNSHNRGLVVDNVGFGLAGVSGHAVVVHNAAGDKIACGTIGSDLPVVKSAMMGVYPGYTGEIDVTGSVEVTQTDHNEITLKLALAGLEASETGGIHIHAGSSCDAADLVGPHFWTPETDEDPWKVIKYTANGDGTSLESLTVTCGYDLWEVNHHTVVVHNAAGDKVACGVLGYNEAVMKPYPGYTPGLQVTGSVTITATEDDASVHLHLDLAHLEETATGGVHIHSGTSCMAADSVGGHYYNLPNGEEDPWNVVKYTTDGQGNSRGMLSVAMFGYDFLESLGHTIVVHNEAGDKVACGVIGGEMPMSGTTAPPMGSTSAPMGSTSAPMGSTSAPMGSTGAPMSTAAPMGSTAAPDGVGDTTAAPATDGGSEEISSAAAHVPSILCALTAVLSFFF